MSPKHLVFATAAGLAAMLHTAVASAQSVGAPYQSRDPQTCPDRSAPVSGPMTAAIARTYVGCSREFVFMQRIYLIAGMDLEIGRSRPFQRSDEGLNDVDPSQPVFPLRGRILTFACDRVRDDGSNAAKNCDVNMTPKATGQCYKTTFGDWTCDMSSVEFTTVRRELPPPK